MQKLVRLCAVSFSLALGALLGCHPEKAAPQESSEDRVQAFDGIEHPDPDEPDHPSPESLPGVMCARVANAAGTVQRAFCAQGKQGQMCRGDHSRTCDEEDVGSSSGNWPRSIWYQAAIDWAKAQGHPTVMLDPGIITITPDTAQTIGYPYSAVGIHVPSGIHLEGSHDYGTAPTVINAGANTPLDVMVLVADRTTAPVISNAGVSYVTLAGTDLPYYGLGEACPAAGHNLTSILQLDGNEPQLTNAVTWDFITADGRKNTAGIRVLESQGQNVGPVDIHHVKIAHVALGIAYGWNTPNTKEDSTCETRPGIKLTLTPAGGQQCPTGTHLRTLSIKPGAQQCWPTSCAANPPAGSVICPATSTASGSPGPQIDYCVAVEPGDPSRSYCNVQPYEFHGNPDARSQVHNNSICDVRVGINIVGGNVDVTKNVVIRHTTNEPNHFGLSTDGHTPYTQFTTHSENFVSGFTLGFLTDGSQYIVMDDCGFRKLTGYARGDLATDQNFLDLAQFAVDDAQQLQWTTDPTRGFIDHVYIRDNRFLKNVQGISLYRVNWGFVGFNTISGAGSATAQGDFGVLLSNTLNSWVYGNTVDQFQRGIEIGGKPGEQSQLGSCHNGIHTYCSGPGCPVWASYPNAISQTGTPGGASCNIAYHENYCNVAGSMPAIPAGAGTVCFAN
ncbi:hypothetical protein [Corallococcus exercitus]|uniref:Right-handed parallel beta-helix repeat-containing protein n=1 Tax=Corallococcus exercitus TaxID=2316736 RepID=A0A7Y4JU82_9BACT|nr:hypothetical protein [Corallococcus exercitus]NOK11286.1 hypothetical protein [Corallococcus exercitus]